MRILKGIGRVFRAIFVGLWRFLLVLSVIVNVVLLVVVIGLVLLIFNIKNDIAIPLVAGLHSSFVGLDSATIDWTIPVREDVPVNLNIPLKQDTVVVLTEAVPLSVVANITAPGLTVSNATVNLSLPVGLRLPVSLDLEVDVDDSLPVELDVRAVIPLRDTQLHDVATSLRLLLEPIAIGLYNLPDDFNGALAMIGDVLAGNPPDLLAENDYSRNPWQGFSITAGLNYPESLLTAPIPPQNIPQQTGIVPLGGIAAFDEGVRPALYADGSTPATVNEQARARMNALGVPSQFYDGTFGVYRLILRGSPPPVDAAPVAVPGEPTPPGDDPAEPPVDRGILPTPTP